MRLSRRKTICSDVSKRESEVTECHGKFEATDKRCRRLGLSNGGCCQRSPLSRNLLRLFICAGLTATHVSLAEQSPVDYNRDVRPILSDKCFHCHGPDAGSRQADLRLDQPQAVPEYVVKPGDAVQSELFKRVSTTDPDSIMPPPASNRPLTSREVSVLRDWIQNGAVFSEHWAFQPLPTHVGIPDVAEESWVRDPIDRFVLRKLEDHDLRPTPEADSLRLLRRWTLDLTGLPPTVAECHEFTEGAGDNPALLAESVVDRLLASPAFGEHMAVAWLDAVRYADSYGYQADAMNTQWPYRDWVIRALNANLPYDEFLTWQLAGDLLPHASQDQLLATAFNRLHRMTNEGGSIPEEFLVENAADRVHTFGTAVLGLTLECARCHDHKYDPISMRDYYSVMAFFNSIDEHGLYNNSLKVPTPSLLLPTAEQRAALREAQAEISRLSDLQIKSMRDGRKRFEEWLADPQVPKNQDLVAYFDFDGEDESKIANLADGAQDTADVSAQKRVPGYSGKALRFNGEAGVSFPEHSSFKRSDEFTFSMWIRDATKNPLPVVLLQRTYGSETGYNGFDLCIGDGLISARMYRVWPGNGIGIRSAKPIPHGVWQHVALTYDGSGSADGFSLFVNGERQSVEVIRDGLVKEAFVTAYGDGHLTLGARWRDRGFDGGEIDEFRIYSRALTAIEVSHQYQGDAIDLQASDDANLEECEALYFSTVDCRYRALRRELALARQDYVEAQEPVQEVPIMEELPNERPTFVLARGAYDADTPPQSRVTRTTFVNIPPAFHDNLPKNRLGLAKWVTDPSHPLTARVFVNRVWANFFGRGLVATPENFGRQGEMPSHPDLLDWLARDFVAHGWDIKRLCRKIALSSTYRQDSRCGSELLELDPENRLLARGPRQRLSAEQIRDQALAASNLIDQQIGGPPVSPYQPGGDLWRESNSMSPSYQQSTGVDLYRRSVYSVRKRTAPLPNMQTFDAPSREVCIVARGHTNTPLQALVLLNDVQFVESARVLAEESMKRHPEPGERIRFAFLSLTGRQPDSTEVAVLGDLYSSQRAIFARLQAQDIAKFIAIGDANADDELDMVELAAMTVTCQAVMNLDASIMRR